MVYLKRAAGGLPGRASIHYNLGLLLQFINMDKEVGVSLLNALSLNPENMDFLYALAGHYFKQRLLNNAMSVAKEIIRIYPENRAGYDILNYAKNMKQAMKSDEK